MAQNKLAGRLWGGDSSSSSGSDSESEDDAPQVQAADANKKRVVWAEESSSDDDEVETKRKVVSHTDKRYEQMKDVLKLMKNHQKVSDFALLTTDYESSFKMLVKMKTIIEQDGGPPNCFIRACLALEEYCEERHKEHVENKASGGPKLPENKQKAFNTLRAKVRKGNKAYEDLIQKCKEDPETFADVVEEADSDAENSDDSSSSAKSTSSSGSSNSSSSGSGSDSDSDSDSSSGSNSDSGSDSSKDKSWKSGTDSSDDDDADEETVREKKMLRWVITPEQAAKRSGVKDKKKAYDEERGNKGKNKTSKDKRVKSGGKKEVVAKDPGAKEKEEYSPEELMQKVTELAQTRGRRQFVRKEYMDKLQKLEEHAVKQGPRAQLYILTSMVSADFDTTGSAFEAMKIAMWNEARGKVLRMLPLLIESYHEEEKIMDGEGEKAVRPVEEDKGGAFSHDRFQELFVAFVEKLDDELYKALQLTLDVYGEDYQVILANSSKFLILLKRCYKFFEDTKQLQPLSVMSMRLIDQLYYKPDVLNEAVFASLKREVPEEEKDEWAWPKDSKAYMMTLVRNVFANGKPIRRAAVDPDAPVDTAMSTTTRLQRRASLCQGYHLALHDHFQEARDLLQLGNLQEQAVDSDVNTQILYNRLLAQIGLSAFRLGKIPEVHHFLMDLCMHNKARELLAQGLSFSKFNDRTPEQERAEKLRQLPYHMHINLEVLESAHHISAMLLEVPNMAMQSIDPNNKRIISRVLRRALEQYDKQLFTGPPENAKEAVTVAAKALQCGDWQTACASLADLKLWDHIDPGSDPTAGPLIKEKIKARIQVEALRTYLFAYSSFYDAMDLDQLVAMFGLDAKRIHSTVSKMMIKEEITAFWDEASKFVLMQHSEPTVVQRLALTLADKGSQAVENNERLVDQKSGGYGFASRDRGQGGAGTGGKDGGKGRFGKGFDDGKGKKGGKGKGKGSTSFGPRRNGGWENARAGALRGAPQRGWGAPSGGDMVRRTM